MNQTFGNFLSHNEFPSLSTGHEVVARSVDQSSDALYDGKACLRNSYSEKLKSTLQKEVGVPVKYDFKVWSHVENDGAKDLKKAACSTTAFKNRATLVSDETLSFQELNNSKFSQNDPFSEMLQYVSGQKHLCLDPEKETTSATSSASVGERDIVPMQESFRIKSNVTVDKSNIPDVWPRYMTLNQKNYSSNTADNNRSMFNNKIFKMQPKEEENDYDFNQLPHYTSLFSSTKCRYFNRGAHLERSCNQETTLAANNNYGRHESNWKTNFGAGKNCISMQQNKSLTRHVNTGAVRVEKAMPNQSRGKYSPKKISHEENGEIKCSSHSRNPFPYQTGYNSSKCCAKSSSNSSFLKESHLSKGDPKEPETSLSLTAQNHAAKPPSATAVNKETKTSKRKKRPSKIKRQTAFQTGKLLVLSPELHNRILCQMSGKEFKSEEPKENTYFDINNSTDYPELSAFSYATHKNSKQACPVMKASSGSNASTFKSISDESYAKDTSVRFGITPMYLHDERVVNHDAIEETEKSKDVEVNSPCPRQPLRLFDILTTAKSDIKPRKAECAPKVISTKRSKINRNIRGANTLDSTAPAKKRGKERENPKSKRQSRLKRIILKEREQKKKRNQQEQDLKEKQFNLQDRMAESKKEDKAEIDDNVMSVESLAKELAISSTINDDEQASLNDIDPNDLLHASNPSANMHPKNQPPTASEDEPEISLLKTFSEFKIGTDLAQSADNSDENHSVVVSENGVVMETKSTVPKLAKDVKNLAKDAHIQNIYKKINSKLEMQNSDLANPEDMKPDELHEDTGCAEGGGDMNACTFEVGLSDGKMKCNVRHSATCTGKNCQQNAAKNGTSGNSSHFMLRDMNGISKEEKKLEAIKEKKKLEAIDIVLHTKKFREYCTHLLSGNLDACVSSLITELSRFQDRQHKKDAAKAHAKRRLIFGIKEVSKHLKSNKMKCVIIAPNLENIQTEGGLNDTLAALIHSCEECCAPCIFSSSRKRLGKMNHKAVAMSCIGVLNYEGAEAIFKAMMECYETNAKDYREIHGALKSILTGKDVDDVLKAAAKARETLRSLRSGLLRSAFQKMKTTNTKMIYGSFEEFSSKYSMGI